LKNQYNSENNLITKEQKEITPAAIATGTSSPEIQKIGDIEKMPLHLQADYLEVCKVITGSDVLKKVPKFLTADEYQKLREDFSKDEIKDILLEMANKPKAIKKVETIYLTAMKWLKMNHGTDDVRKCEEEFKNTYRKFVTEVSGGEIVKPQISADDTRLYLRPIITNLLENNAVAVKAWIAAGKPTDKKFTSVEGAFKVWNYILTLDNWKQLDDFERKRIKLSEISKDLDKIITTMKNHQQNAANKPTDNSFLI